MKSNLEYTRRSRGYQKSNLLRIVIIVLQIKIKKQKKFFKYRIVNYKLLMVTKMVIKLKISDNYEAC